ncbi:transposase [Mesorhizobium sp. M1423]|uniref:IS66 family insertion sequence element accessory protein TnpA n=1 Tax=Mesorhizobium sp. M1423 TaxID=2957101 RepID=UPI00333882ED
MLNICGKLRQEKPKKRGRKGTPKRHKSPRRYLYRVRTDTGPIALQAFWGTHVEAMNWSGLGLAKYAAAFGLSPHALRKWRARLEEFEAEVNRRSLLHPSARAQLSSAANCVRRQHRLTPRVDGRSNRRRFSDAQKQAIVQETKKPGVSVAEVCRRHGIATSMAFRRRVKFGLTARKAPQWERLRSSTGRKPNRRH